MSNGCKQPSDKVKDVKTFHEISSYSCTLYKVSLKNSVLCLLSLIVAHVIHGVADDAKLTAQRVAGAAKKLSVQTQLLRNLWPHVQHTNTNTVHTSTNTVQSTSKCGRGAAALRQKSGSQRDRPASRQWGHRAGPAAPRHTRPRRQATPLHPAPRCSTTIRRLAPP